MRSGNPRHGIATAVGRRRASLAHVIEPHSVHVVPVSRVEVDARLWDAVRLVVPAGAKRSSRAETRVYPVVERDGRLVLLTGFEEFLATVAAGATDVKVWRAEFEDGESLEQYAVAFSIG